MVCWVTPKRWARVRCDGENRWYSTVMAARSSRVRTALRSGAAAAGMQVGLALGMAGNAQLLDQFVPLGGCQPGQRGITEPMATRAAPRGFRDIVVVFGGFGWHGVNGVVPLAVQAVADDRYLGQLVVTDLDTGGVAGGVELGGHPQPGAGGGRRDRVDDDFVAGQGPPPPVHRDMGEQAVVKSARSAVLAFRPVGFLGPLSRTRRASFPAPGAPRVPSRGW